MSKQQKKKTRLEKKTEHGTPENYYRAKREKARREEANRLNESLKGE